MLGSYLATFWSEDRSAYLLTVLTSGRPNLIFRVRAHAIQCDPMSLTKKVTKYCLNLKKIFFKMGNSFHQATSS